MIIDEKMIRITRNIYDILVTYLNVRMYLNAG